MRHCDESPNIRCSLGGPSTPFVALPDGGILLASFSRLTVSWVSSGNDAGTHDSEFHRPAVDISLLWLGLKVRPDVTADCADIHTKEMAEAKEICAPCSPLVSVVIPAYNRAAVLERAIASVLAQTLSDLECIVVDDGSTDETALVAEKIKDRRLCYIRLPGNTGVSYARNVGIHAAHGEWIAFLDSDDEWLPRKLERQIARMRDTADPRVTVIYCLCCQRDSMTDRMKPHGTPVFEGDVFEKLITGGHPPTPSVFLIKRASLQTIGGFDECLSYAEDYDLWLRLAQAHNYFAAVEESLVIKYENSGPQLSTDPAARLRGLRLFDRKWAPIIMRRLGSAEYRRWRARHDRYTKGFLRTRSHMYDTVSGDRVSAWRSFLTLVRFLPWSRRYLIHGLVLAILGHRVYDIAWRVKKAINRRRS